MNTAIHLCSFLSAFQIYVTSMSCEAHSNHTAYVQDDICSIKSCLETSSLRRFVIEMTDAKWVSPRIWSQTYVDSMEEVHERLHEQLARDTGRVMLERIADCANIIDSTSNGQACVSEADVLVTFAKWIAAGRGYGNQIIAWRCHDVAAIGYAKAIIDFTYSLTNMQECIDKLDAGWQDPLFGAEILNAELGRCIFVTTNSTREERSEALFQTWEQGSILYDICNIDITQTGKYARLYPQLFSVRKCFSGLDESMQSTTIGELSKTRYWNIVRGGNSLLSTRHLSNFLRYRNTVGYFPTNAPPTRVFGNTLSSAFRYEWIKHRASSWTRDDLHVYTCWIVYDRYLRGELRDTDSQAMKSAGKKRSLHSID